MKERPETGNSKSKWFASLSKEPAAHRVPGEQAAVLLFTA